MSKIKKPEVQLEARLEILDDVDDDRVERGVVELTADEKAALEAEKASLLGQVRSSARAARAAADATPTAKRSGSEPVLGDVQLPADDGEYHEHPRARRAGEPRAGIDFEDVGAQHGAQPAPDGAPTEIPSSPELEAAEAAVAEAATELAALEQELKAERKAQAEETKRKEQEHKARLDALNAKKQAAENEATRLNQEREAAALSLRVQATQAHRERQRAADAEDIAARTTRLVERVQPSLDALRAAYEELATLLRTHKLSLQTLRNIDTRSEDLPLSWNNDTRAEFNRAVTAPAGRILRELEGVVNGYGGVKIPELERIIAAGWQNRSDFELTVNTALQYVDPQNVGGVVKSMRENIALLSERLSEYELAAAPIIERVRPALPPVVPPTAADLAGDVADQTHADIGRV